MPDPLVVAIECLSEGPVQKLHTTGEIRGRSLQEQVCNGATLRDAWANYVRLSEQAVPMTEPTEPIDNLGKAFEEPLPILVIEEDRLSGISAIGRRTTSCEATRKLLSEAE